MAFRLIIWSVSGSKDQETFSFYVQEKLVNKKKIIKSYRHDSQTFSSNRLSFNNHIKTRHTIFFVSDTNNNNLKISNI